MSGKQQHLSEETALKKKESRRDQSALDPPAELRISLLKTLDGQFDYLQILSGDSCSVNVVLIARSIRVTDGRP